MPDDNKHQQRVPVYLTDREFIDSGAEAIRLDKKPSEIIRYALRLYLYGTVGMALHEDKENHRHD